jgi:ribosome-associated protein
MESKELAIRLARALDAKKAVNVHILAVEDLTTVTEYFVIATGMSTTHTGALADEAEFQLEREGVKVLRTEGHDGKRWVLLDYGSVIVHVFTQEAHDYYDLEHLWADAKPVSGCLTKVRTSSKNAERLPPRGKLSAAPTAD